MSSSSRQFVGRTAHGTEWIAAAQAEMARARVIGVSHREVHLELPAAASATQLRSLRTLDDIFLTARTLGPIAPTRDGLQVLRALSLDLEQLSDQLRRWRPVNTKTFTVVASALGKRNYGRFELEDALGQAIARGSGWSYEDSRLGTAESTRLSLRLHLGEKTFIGLRVFEQPLHRRAYRVQTGIGSLRPSLAHALGLLGQPLAGQSFLDPFCGAGTIAIEVALGGTQLEISASDISPEQVGIAAQNAKRASVDVRLSVCDASSLPQATAALDVIVTNPPWQQQVAMVASDPGHSWIAELDRVLRPEGRLVVLTTAEAAVSSELERRGFHVRSFQVSLSGSYPHVLCASRLPQFFRSTELGASLERCLASHGKWSPSAAAPRPSQNR